MFSTFDRKSIELADRTYRRTSMLNLTDLVIQDSFMIQSKMHTDDRGFFMEAMNEASLRMEGVPLHFVQTNISVSVPRVIRGLHMQLGPNPMGKLLRCIGGQILQLTVDAREDSETYGKMQAITLDNDGGAAIYVPPGCLNGFSVISDGPAFVQYHCTAPYIPQFEYGVNPFCGELKIDWIVQNPILSPKDKQLPKFSDMIEQIKRGAICH